MAFYKTAKNNTMNLVEEISTNTLKGVLELKLKEINSLLRKKYLQEKNIGVLEGLSGLAMCQFYYAKYTKNETFADWGQDSLLKIMEIINQGYNMPTYSSGIAGACWAINHLNSQGFIETNADELLNSLDSYLFDVMKQNIDKGYYDFLHGAMGYAFYFFERYKSTQNEKLKQSYSANIKYFIEGISKIADEDKKGLKWLSKINLNNHKINVYNLSLSHGMSSIVSFLSELVEQKEFNRECKDLLCKASNFIFEQKLPREKKNISLFPSWVLKNIEPNQNSRLAWCYGDFGIGLSLLKASEALNDELLREKANFILEHTTNRKTKKDTLIRDAAICHGSFGNAQIYKFLYSETKNKLYKDSATYWIQYGMDMSIYEDGYAGFKQWIGSSNEWRPKTSLLEGVAGIGLSIIDYLSEEHNTWDKCLLIS